MWVKIISTSDIHVCPHRSFRVPSCLCTWIFMEFFFLESLNANELCLERAWHITNDQHSYRTRVWRRKNQWVCVFNSRYLWKGAIDSVAFRIRLNELHLLKVMIVILDKTLKVKRSTQTLLWFLPTVLTPCAHWFFIKRYSSIVTPSGLWQVIILHL